MGEIDSYISQVILRKCERNVFYYVALTIGYNLQETLNVGKISDHLILFITIIHRNFDIEPILQRLLFLKSYFLEIL